MRRNVVSKVLSVIAISTIGLVGCGGGSGGDDDTGGADGGAGGADAAAATGMTYHLVQSELTVPTSTALRDMFKFDVDGDGDKENALGGVLSTLATQGIDIQALVDEGIASGSLVLLHSFTADDLTADTSVTWQSYVGDMGTGAPDPGGTSTYTITGAQTGTPLGGAITAGTFATTSPGNVTVNLPLSADAPPLPLNLIGTQIEADVTGTSCSGKLGGAVTKDDIDTVILPGVAVVMTGALERDCPAGCPPANECTANTSGKTLQGLFDTDDSCDITAGELMANTLIMAVLGPDLDLLDANGNYAPNTEGTPDSLSLGVGITCVGAMFTDP